MIQRDTNASGSEPPCDEGKETRDEQLSRLQHSLSLAVEALEQTYYEAFRDGFTQALDPAGERDPTEVWDGCEDIAPVEGWLSSRAREVHSKLSGGG
jgi:hypothetical protein